MKARLGYVLISVLLASALSCPLLHAGIPPSKWKEDGTAIGVAPPNIDCQSNITCTRNGNTIEIDVSSGTATDNDAVHDNVAGEIVAVADKAAPVGADHLLIEDSQDSNNKKDITISLLEAALEAVMDLADMQGTIGSSKITDGSLMEADINWTDITNVINSVAVNWTNINALAPIQSGGINWSSLSSVVTEAAINWTDIAGIIDTGDLASGVLDTDLSSVSGSDDTIPSAKATKAALDAKESSTSNDLDPDRLNGDTTDNNLLDPAIVNGVKDADYGDVNVSSGAWTVEDNSHSHGGSSITDGSLMEADINWTDITNIINSGAINWDSVNSIRKLTEGGINWSSMDNWAAGKYLQALSTGGVNWNTLTATATPGGSDQQVQYNNGGSMGGMAGVNWNDGTSTMLFEAAAELSMASANWVKLPVGTGPTIDAAGKFGIDTTDDQLQYYGGAKRVIPYTYQACAVIENLAATDDSYAIWMANDAVTVTGVGCNCRGTCSTTATFTLEDRGGNAMTITDTNPTCATTGAATFKAVTAGNQLTAGEMLAFDVTNSPTADDEYALCWTYTVDSQ